MPSGQKVPVTVRALVQRINRALAKQEEQLKASRGEVEFREFGAYYVIDLRRNTVEAQHVKLEKLGRELMVLKPFEYLADD